MSDPAALRSYPRADFAELAKASARGEELVVLDVRRAVERVMGHIDRSVHIPLHELYHRLYEVPPGVVWVHCAGGMRAAIAASLLEAVGRQVVAVDDSFTAAHDAGLVLTGLTPCRHRPGAKEGSTCHRSTTRPRVRSRVRPGMSPAAC